MFSNFLKYFNKIPLRYFSSNLSNELIRTETFEAFTSIAFNRPPLSSLTLELLREFSKAVDSALKDENCRGLIITSVN